MGLLTVLVFIGVMVLITTERVHRTAAALVGAAVLMLAKVFSFDEALEYVDFNTMFTTRHSNKSIIKNTLECPRRLG